MWIQVLQCGNTYPITVVKAPPAWRSRVRLGAHATLVQVFADPNDSLSLLVAWDAPTETNGAEILSYVVELTPFAIGWSGTYSNITVTAADAAEIAIYVTVGGMSKRSGTFCFV